MASDLLVILTASKVSGTMEKYVRQLDDAEIDVNIHDCSERPNINGGGNLGYRVKTLRQLAERFSHYEKLLVSDGFDVTFYGKKRDVLPKIPTTHLLHAAEKNCYPPACWTLPIPDRGLWRYANGGLVAGTPEKFIEWCDEAEKHPKYSPSMLDQHFLNILVSEGSLLGRIDYRTNLFFCLYGGYDELDFTNGLPINTLYCTFPNWLHSNGKWSPDEMFHKYERSLACIQS